MHLGDTMLFAGSVFVAESSKSPCTTHCSDNNVIPADARGKLSCTKDAAFVAGENFGDKISITTHFRFNTKQRLAALHLLCV